MTAASIGWNLMARAAAPALRLHLLHRAWKGREILSRLPERRGMDSTPRPAGTLIWLHAASVGETTSILPLLPDLVQKATVLLTTGTVTAQKLLDHRIDGTELAPRVLHRFAPLDVPSWIDRFLKHWQPDVAGFVESELWPNQLAACQRLGIPLMLINGRMSDGSYRAWRRWPNFAHRIMSAITHVQARGPQDAERFVALGAPHVACPGDLKLAAPPLPADAAELARLSGFFAARPAWVAASTHPGEEALVAEVHRTLAEHLPDLLTVIVPRHPERGTDLSIQLSAPRRSLCNDPPEKGIWIADTLGELGLWYRLIPIVFVGRSLLPPGGGQNPMEPARLGCAIAVGPHTGNFTEHITLLRNMSALTVVSDPVQLRQFVETMLTNRDKRQQMGARAATALEELQHLPAQTAQKLLSLARG